MQFDDRYLEFIRLFNERYFFDSHEELEDLWLDSEDAQLKIFYKGLIHIAAAYFHLFRNNHSPSAKRLESACEYLVQLPGHFHGLDLLTLCDHLRQTLEWVNQRQPYVEHRVPILQICLPEK